MLSLLFYSFQLLCNRSTGRTPIFPYEVDGLIAFSIFRVLTSAQCYVLYRCECWHLMSCEDWKKNALADYYACAPAGAGGEQRLYSSQKYTHDESVVNPHVAISALQ